MKIIEKILGGLALVLGFFALKWRGDKHKLEAEKSKTTRKQVDAYANKPKDKDEVVDRIRNSGL